MRGLSAALLLGLASCPALALFEEEAGLNDWKVENIGAIKKIVHPLAKSGVQRNKAFVITSSSTLASIDLTTGDISWRQTLPETDQFENLVLQGKNLLTLSNKGKVVRMWNAQDGTLQWDGLTCECTNCPETPSRYDAKIVNGDGDVALLCDNTLMLRTGVDGEISWADSHDAYGTLVSLGVEKPDGATRSVVTVAGYKAESDSFVTLAVDYRSGQVESEEVVKAGSGISGAATKIAPGWYASLTDGGASLVVVDAHKNKAYSYKAGEVLQGCQAAKLSLEVTSQPLHFMLHQTGGVSAVLSVDGATMSENKPKLSVVHSFKPGGVVSSAKDGEVSRISSVAVGEKETQAEVLSLPEGEVSSSSFPELTLADGGAATGAQSILTTTREGVLKLRVMLTRADDSISLLEMGGSTDRQPRWVREEGLAFVSDMVYVDATEQHAGEVAVGGIFDGLLAQIARYKAAFAGGGGHVAVTPPAAPVNYAKLDKYGLHKVGVMVSANGKVFGLDVADHGKLLWSNYVAPAVAASASALATGTPPTYSLVVLRTTVGDSAARVAVVAQSSGATMVVGMNGVTGEVDSSGPTVLAKNIVHWALAPADYLLEDGSQLLYLIDDSNTVHLYPDTQESRELYTSKIASNGYYFLIDQASTSIAGYQIPKLEGAGSGQNSLWSLSFTGETLETWAARSPDEFVQSPVRQMVDRSVLYKYLNPSLLLLATSTAEVDSEDDGKMPPVVTIYLIDSVVGRIISRTRHVNAMGPIHAVLCENWAIYHYFSAGDSKAALTGKKVAPRYRWELGVLELYDSAESILGIEKIVNVLRGTTESAPFSSFAARQPQVARQTAVFPHAVKTMTVTQTRYGVTLRHVLMALGSDELYSLDKRFADPRSPREKPTQDEMDEGLLPYQAIIPIPPMRLLTYNQTVTHLRLVETAPAKLESVCHVFAIGLDVFYTRTTPSQKFDLLSDDFDYLALLAAMFAMFSATMAAWYASKQKDLQSAWR